MLDREQAWNILCEYTKSEGLRKHALAVETCVAAYARKLGADETLWSLTALLHDFDWEIHPTLDEHPQKGSPSWRKRACRRRSGGRSSHTRTIRTCRASRLSRRRCTRAMSWRGSSPRSPT